MLPFDVSAIRRNGRDPATGRGRRERPAGLFGQKAERVGPVRREARRDRFLDAHTGHVPDFHLRRFEGLRFPPRPRVAVVEAGFRLEHAPGVVVLASERRHPVVAVLEHVARRDIRVGLSEGSAERAGHAERTERGHPAGDGGAFGVARLDRVLRLMRAHAGAERGTAGLDGARQRSDRAGNLQRGGDRRRDPERARLRGRALAHAGDEALRARAPYAVVAVRFEEFAVGGRVVGGGLDRRERLVDERVERLHRARPRLVEPARDEEVLHGVREDCSLEVVHDGRLPRRRRSGPRLAGEEVGDRILHRYRR